jgi:heat-inducible transcriptional repressor
MTDPRYHDRLSPRDREILKDVIYTYIVLGEPVSSRTVAKQERHALSSASIRNVMADLEELGYLKQPHTSAGRVPTSAGYHFFIETLMRQRVLPARERRYIEAQLRDGAGDADERIATASQLLSELSRQVGVVLISALGETILKAVDFVPLTGRKVLCVVVSTSGFVDSKILEIAGELTREDLVWAANYLNESFSGLSMSSIRDRLLALMADERAQMDRLLGLVLSLAREGFASSDDPEVRMQGASELLSHPELADVDRLRRLFEAFNDKARLVRLLNQCVQGAGVRVWIGEDSDLTSELDFSLVATPYCAGGRVVGSLGILGPTRMEYDRVIPLVEYLAATLGEALTSAFDS